MADETKMPTPAEAAPMHDGPCDACAEWRTQYDAAWAARLEALRALLGEVRPRVADAAEPFTGYGAGGGVENPHDFSPDHECSTDKEREAHRLACEAWDRGERPGNENRGCRPLVDAEGAEVGHACLAGWGLGAYTVRNPEGEALLARIDAALATPTEGAAKGEGQADG